MVHFIIETKTYLTTVFHYYARLAGSQLEMKHSSFSLVIHMRTSYALLSNYKIFFGHFESSPVVDPYTKSSNSWKLLAVFINYVPSIVKAGSLWRNIVIFAGGAP